MACLLRRYPASLARPNPRSTRFHSRATRSYDQAAELYQYALHIDNGDTGITRKAAECQLIAGHDSAAAELFVKIYECDREHNLDYLAKAGHLFGTCGLSSKAVKALTGYSDRRSDDVQAVMALARILYGGKDYRKVISLLKGPLGSPSAGPEMRLLAAQSYCAINRYQAAAPLLFSLQEQLPDSPRVTSYHRWCMKTRATSKRLPR